MSGALDVCIQELARSAVICLGPQVSIRQVIDTCISNHAVNTEGGELKHSKHLSGLVINIGGNAHLYFINELCEAFHKRNKTVSTSFASCFLNFIVPLITLHAGSINFNSLHLFFIGKSERFEVFASNSRRGTGTPGLLL
jgi:hypothetical protein